MAFVTQWDISFNSRPIASEPLGNGYDEIQKTRSAIAERIANEHSFRLSDVLNTNQGKHLQGSARIFVSDTEPTDAGSPLADDGTYESGRMLFKPTAKELFVRVASSWVNVLKAAADAVFNIIEVVSATIQNAVITTLTTENMNSQNIATDTFEVKGAEVNLGSSVTGPTAVIMKYGQGSDYRPVKHQTAEGGAVAHYVGGLLVSDDDGFDAPVKKDATVRGVLRVGESKVPVRGIMISSTDPTGGDEGNIWIKV